MFLSQLPFKAYVNEKPVLFIAISWLTFTIYFSYIIYQIECVH